MKRQIFGLLTASLLMGCGLTPFVGTPASTPGMQASQALASNQFVPDNQILPGSKGDRNTILPGSKGDWLAALEVQLRLPDIGFQLSSLGTFSVLAQKPDLKVSVDSQTVEASFISARKEGSDVIFYYQLKDLPISQNNNQELIFASADGVIQTAGLVKPLQQGQERIALPFDMHSLAVWLIASEFQQSQKKPLHDFGPDALQELDNLSSVLELTENLKSLYRTGEGKTDPTQSAAIRSQVTVGAQKYQENVQNAGRGSSGSGSSSSAQTGNSDSSSSSSAQTGNAGSGRASSSRASTANNGNHTGHNK